MGKKRKSKVVSSSNQHFRKKVAVKRPAGKKKGLADTDEVEFENPLAIVPLSVYPNETFTTRLPVLRLRTSPRPLWNCMKQLTNHQATLVKEMGFGKLLKFNVDGIPSKLGHYVVDMLDTESMVLNLKGYGIKITKELIHQLLGIPIGGVGLKDIDESKLDKKLTAKWKSKYVKDIVCAPDIVKNMFSSSQTDWEFKLDFVMLFCTTMISSRKDGTCNSTLLPYFPESRNIRDIDWCAYVYDSIQKCKLSWKRNDKKSCFTGPVTVLTLLYLDSTKCPMSIVPRSQPAFAEWNLEKIRMREEFELKNGGFGLGEKQALFEAQDDEEIQDYGDNDANDDNTFVMEGTHVDDVSNDDDGDGDGDGDDDDTGYNPSVDKLGNASSQETGIICVQGYNVKRSIAPTLEDIFKKHGDIAAECLFKTDSVRSSFFEVVCRVVRWIQTDDVIDKMEEIECLLSDAKAAKINVSWLQAHLEAIHRSSKKYSLLMEMKANTISVQRAAQMDLRETSEELVAAHKRFKNAERCVKVLDIVEKNLNDNILESKAEMESWVKQF